VSALRRWAASLRLIGWAQGGRGQVLAVLSARITNAGVGLVFVFLTARHLGPAGRGEIAVAFTIAYITCNIAGLGTYVSGRIHLLDRESGVTANDVFSLTLALVPLQVLLSASVVSVLSRLWLHLSVGFSLSVIGLSVATMLLRSAVAILYGLRRYRVVLVAELVVAAAKVIVLTVLLVGGHLTATSAVITMALGSTLLGVLILGRPGVFYWVGWTELTTHWRVLIVDGVSPMLGTVAHFAALRLDRLILIATAGAFSVGIYTVALAIPEVLRIIPKGFGQVIGDRGRSGTDSVSVVRTRGRLVVVGHITTLLIAATVGFVLLPVAFGAGFTEARGVLVVVTVAEVFLSVHLMQQVLLVGFSRHRGIGVPQVVGGIAMVVLDFVMIPAWGIYGAAWACLIGYAVLAGTSVLWTKRELKLVGTL